MLLGTASVAWADEPKTDGVLPTFGSYDRDLLGDVWSYLYPGFFPGERVDAWMYRPATAAWDNVNFWWHSLKWPLKSGAGPTGPVWGTWWWGSSLYANVNAYMAPPEDPTLPFQDNASEFRRMNLTARCAVQPCEDPVYLFADGFGWYYAKFMHSRDNVWYPCGFPLRWQCNFWANEFVYEFHSPSIVAYECLGPFQCLTWPKDPVLGIVLNPRDTVSPLEVHVQGALYDYGSPWYIEPYEVVGYYWKWSDVY
jgi:hypothetical protein